MFHKEISVSSTFPLSANSYEGTTSTSTLIIRSVCFLNLSCEYPLLKLNKNLILKKKLKFTSSFSSKNKTSTPYNPLIVKNGSVTLFWNGTVPLISQRLRIKINAEVVNTVQLVDISIRGLSPSVHPSISALDWIAAEQIQKVYTDTRFQYRGFRGDLGGRCRVITSRTLDANL